MRRHERHPDRRHLKQKEVEDFDHSGSGSPSLARNGECAAYSTTSAATPSASRTRNEPIASESPGWRIQWALWVNAGARPRFSLCSPCAPASNSVWPPRDGPLDQLVVAELEVEHLKVGQAAPVAAVEVRPLLEVDRPGDRLFPLVGQRRHQAVPQRLARDLEERGAQVGVAAVAVDVLDVERAQRRPVARLQLGAGGGPKGEPVLRRHPALLAHLLAVLRAKRRQVVLEALERAPRAVVPVELHAEAREVAARGEHLFFGVGAEEKVDRRGLLVLGDLAHAPEQRRDDRRRVDVRRVESGSRRPVAGVKGIAATSLG